MVKIACPDCEAEYEIRATRYEHNRTCNRCRFVSMNRSNKGRHKGCGKLTRTFYGYFKNVARRRSIPFEVDIDYLWELAISQNEKCALSGIPITFPDSSGMGKVSGNFSHTTIGANQFQASLDRIDSSKGYVEGNVQWLHKDLNIMKNKFSQEQFIYFCKCVSKEYANHEPSGLKENK